VRDVLTEDTIQDSYRVKLVNPQQYQGVVTEAQSLPGVQSVVDLHNVLDPIFLWMNALRWVTFGMSVLLLVAAALQIGNTIRMAACARRRELGIMKLVGASNTYILMPLLLESLIAGLVGALLACVTLALGADLVVMRKMAHSITTLAWIGWPQVWKSIAWMVVVAVVLSVAPAYVATKKYLRV